MRPFSWPRCPTCGGPVRPKGRPAFECLYDVETRNEANQRIHHAVKAKRTQAVRDATLEAVSLALAQGEVLPPRGPWYVRLTRRSPSKLDKDGTIRALKAVQDTVAAVLEVDDGDERYEWDYAQEKGKPLGCRIQIWSI